MKKATSVPLLMVVMLFGTHPVVYAQPANNNFASAEVIPSTPFMDTGDVTLATSQTGEPTKCGGSSNYNRSIWYSYTPASDATLVVRISNTVGGFMGGVYTGSAVDMLTELGCDALNPHFAVPVTGGTTYYIRVAGLNGTTFQLDVTEEPPPPPNDDFANAEAITSVPFMDTGDVNWATAESGELARCGGSGPMFNRSIWYSYTPASDATLNAVISNIHLAFMVAIYTGPSVDMLTELDCATGGTGSSPGASTPVTGGTTYYIRVAGLNGTTFQLDVTEVTDVSVTKTDSPDPVTAGLGTGNLTYTVTVTNGGPATATGVEVTEDLDLPSGVSIEAITPSQGTYAPVNNPNGVWTVGTLISGQSETLTITLTVGASTAAGTDVITNTATLTGLNEADASSDDDTATESTSVERDADLSLTKDDQTDELLQPGQTIIYELAYMNGGPSDATGVMLTETVPTNTTFDAANSDGGWACVPDASAGSTCTLGVGTLAAGADGTAAFAVTIDEALPGAVSEIENTASVADDGSAGDDANPEDNTATETTRLVPLREREVDIGLSKSILSLAEIEDGFDDDDDFEDFADEVGLEDGDGAYPEFGEVVIFEVEALHVSGSINTIIKVKDGLAEGLDLVQIFDADQSDLGAFHGQYNPATETWTVQIGPGEAKRVWLAVRLNRHTSFGNTATIVRSMQPDPEPDNDSASTDALEPISADLELVKEVVSFENLETGGIEAVFALTARNHGPDAAHEVVVADLLLGALVSIPDEDELPDNVFFDGEAFIWEVGTLASGASAALQLFVVGPDEVLDNVATVTSSTADPNASNNVSGARAETGRPEPGRPFLADLSLTKMADVATAAVDEAFTYTLVITNAGPNTTNNVAVTDILPPEVMFVSAKPSVGSYDAGTGIWEIGQMKVEARDTLEITVKVTQAGTITNVAMVSNSTLPDPDSEVGFDLGEAPDEDDEDEAVVEATSSATARGVEAEGSTSPSEAPKVLELSTNYPNPFNPETVIPYGVPDQMAVRMEVYDLLGRRVALLVDAVKEAGRYEARFQAERLPTGVYLVRLKAGQEIKIRRITLMK